MRARGELVFAAHPQFHAFIKHLKTTQCRRAEFDLAAITRLDMCGVGMLMLAQECAAAAGIAIEFRNPPHELDIILHIAGKSLSASTAPAQLAA
jgi:anti-anti-sigma regulatory factor